RDNLLVACASLLPCQRKAHPHPCRRTNRRRDATASCGKSLPRSVRQADAAVGKAKVGALPFLAFKQRRLVTNCPPQQTGVISELPRGRSKLHFSDTEALFPPEPSRPAIGKSGSPMDRSRSAISFKASRVV